MRPLSHRPCANGETLTSLQVGGIVWRRQTRAWGAYKIKALSICNYYIILFRMGDKLSKGFNLERRFVTMESLGDLSGIFSNFQGKQHEQ